MESSIDPLKIQSKIERSSDSKWIITLDEDPESGDLIMPLPDDLLESQGWKIGDTLVWEVDKDSKTVSLTKKL
jgi:hypothetical protein